MGISLARIPTCADRTLRHPRRRAIKFPERARQIGLVLHDQWGAGGLNVRDRSPPPYLPKWEWFGWRLWIVNCRWGMFCSSTTCVSIRLQTPGHSTQSERKPNDCRGGAPSLEQGYQLQLLTYSTLTTGMSQLRLLQQSLPVFAGLCNSFRVLISRNQYTWRSHPAISALVILYTERIFLEVLHPTKGILTFMIQPISAASQKVCSR